MKQFSLAVLALGFAATVTPLHAQVSADQDFQNRCSAAGVVSCVGFNTAAEINSGIHPDANGTIRGFLDTSVKASGAGSLRFDLPPPPHAGANIAGSWSPLQALGRVFSQNSTFYLQYRQRFSPEMLTNTWDSSWKTIIIHQNQLTCATVGLVLHNNYGSGLATMYTDCGARHMFTTLDGSAYTESTPFLEQQGGYNCQYRNESPSTCFYYPANDWTTYYMKIHVGTWDQPNSTIEAWVAKEGDTAYKQFIKVPNFTLTCNTDPCTVDPGKSQGFDNVTLTPYMTALSTTSGLAGVTSHTWYDDLIVSTQPIAVPGGKAATVPKAITDLKVVN
jgi:hypothetical protein